MHVSWLCCAAKLSIPFLFLYRPSLAQDDSDAQDERPRLRLTPQTSVQSIGNASQIVNPSFAGLGIEPSNLFSLTGHTRVNQLSVNLLTNLANYTGVPPSIRIGGNTEDNFVFDPDFQGYYVKYNEQTSGLGNIPWDRFTIGPRYFEALDRFPDGTPVIIGLGLAYDAPDWADAIAAKADVARAKLNRTTLVSFEIGNEPDLYSQNSFRDDDYDGTVYAREWRERARVVYERILAPDNMTSAFFEPSCAAAAGGSTYSIESLVEDGILDPAPGIPEGSNTSFVATWNQHSYFYYIGISKYSLDLATLMDTTNTSWQFGGYAMEIPQATATNLSYTLREYASSGPVGYVGISDTFGAALWTLNFFLYAASLNISNVNIHMTDNSYAAPWQPIYIRNSPARVRPSYYGFAAMTQLIGAACNTRVAAYPLGQADLPNGYPPGRLTAYATYNASSTLLESIVVLNTAMMNTSAPDPKPSVMITLELPEFANRTLHLAYLSSPGANALANSTWNDISYEQNGFGLASTIGNPPEAITISASGSASFPVRDTEAVVATLDYPLGTGPRSEYNITACRELADSGVIPKQFPQKLLASTVTTHQLPTPGPRGDGSGQNGLPAGSGRRRGGSAGMLSPVREGCWRLAMVLATVAVVL